jgi:hypothetical protein
MTELTESVIQRVVQSLRNCNIYVRKCDVTVEHLFALDWESATEKGEAFTLFVKTPFISTKMLDVLKSEFGADDIQFSFYIEHSSISHHGTPAFQTTWVFRLIF